MPDRQTDELPSERLNPFTIEGLIYLWYLAAGYPDWYAASRAQNRPGYGRAIYDLVGHRPVRQDQRVYRLLWLQMWCLGQPLHRAKWSARHLPPKLRHGRSVELELRRRTEAENEHLGGDEARSMEDALVAALVAAFLHDSTEIQDAARVRAGEPVNTFLSKARFRSAICDPLCNEVLGDGWRTGVRKPHVPLPDDSDEFDDSRKQSVYANIPDTLRTRPLAETPAWRRIEIHDRLREAGVDMRAKMPTTADIFLARVDGLKYAEIVERGIAPTGDAARQAVSRAYRWIRLHRPELSDLLTA